MAGKTGIIVPLYIYPLTSQTWEPLYHAIAKHPHVNFLIIVNPDSGPGNPPSPDANYAREVPRLNAYSNVTTVGYVRTGYCQRSMYAACQDVDQYAEWSKTHPDSGIFVHGIFFDETPNHYSESNSAYLEALTRHVKTADGIVGKRLVIHNPGTPPDQRLTESRPDLTITFEESFSRHMSNTIEEKRALQRHGRTGCGYILHSVPTHLVRQVVDELVGRAEYLYVTELSERYYERFGNTFGEFATQIDQTQR